MSDSNEKYFDLHINGIGYLNRARVVTPKRANSFLAVDVTALYGSSDDIQKNRGRFLFLHPPGNPSPVSLTYHPLREAAEGGLYSTPRNESLLNSNRAGVVF